ncbi:P-loop containing nucleoside triphosphate hydrolase protein [Cytidiella melzeri]|nr:P-loop containing nucleoside triphosphate hydrolase protein [Cytidiella melzeri]
MPHKSTIPPQKKKKSIDKSNTQKNKAPARPPPHPTRNKPSPDEPDAAVIARVQPLAPETPLHAESYQILQQAREGDVGEAFALGLDLALVSATGSGKTMAFAAALAAIETKTSKILILSPLNELERDQYEQQLKGGNFRVIVTSPEMVFKHPKFSQMIRNAEWTKEFLGTILDEAHCVAEWGDSFRTAFLKVEKARTFLTSKPIMIASATLPPDMLESVMNTLSFSRKGSFILNVGNDRANIIPVVCRMKGGKNDLESLEFLLDRARKGEDLKHAIVYFNKKDLARKAYLYLRNKLPEDSPYRDQMEFIYSPRDPETKARVMRDFRAGKIRTLFATEVAGMGLDIPDLRWVVQYMIPTNLNEWSQHAGRAGRDGKPAVAILLAESSVFQMMKRKTRLVGKGKKKAEKDSKEISIKVEPEEMDVFDAQGTDEQERADADCQDQEHAQAPADSCTKKNDTEEEDTELQHRKNVEEHMRLFTQYEDCRREITDKHFDNPPCNKNIEACCDNCIRKLVTSQERPMTLLETETLDLVRRITTRPLVQAPLQPIYSNNAGKQWNSRLSHALKSLRVWRADYWLLHFRYSVFGPESLLPNRMISLLATEARIKTEEDLRTALPDWHLRESMSASSLWHLTQMDEEFAQLNEVKKALNGEERSLTNVSGTLAYTQAYNVSQQVSRDEDREERGLPPIPRPGTVQQYDPSSKKFCLALQLFQLRTSLIYLKFLKRLSLALDLLPVPCQLPRLRVSLLTLSLP